MTTTQNRIQRILNAFVHELKKIDSTFENNPLAKSVEVAWAIAVAPEFSQIERLTIEASKQGCPLTATSEKDSSIGQAQNWGRVKLKRDPTPAVPGVYTIAITGTGTVPVGTAYIDNETEFVYLLQTAVVCAGTGTGTVKSVGTGTEVLKSVGTSLYSQNRVVGITDEVVIASVVTQPEPAEDITDYIDKTVESFSTTPRGGAAGDYRVWGEAVPGVFKIFPYTLIPTEGMIYVMAPRTSTNPYGVADTALKAAVLTALNAKEPMTTGETYVYSVNTPQYDVEVVDLSDNTKQSLVLPALQDYFLSKYPFIDGVDSEDLRTDRVTKVDIFKKVYDAVYPAGIADVIVRRGGVVVTDEFLQQGSIGIPAVTFS